ncbi:TonB-dependent receptor [Gallaecimonas xiamenensis]|uniref:TonB-dependent receptor n=1 Tax=Gallaecimonas xiamenensis 3-C-1 TaxID=745411 RepID=K2JYQ2_9GAMM|nr:TonB-dependent receptor [Gallaecimonas xiamenensis]EKE75464.1 hypothetical protein B3C1_07299 [Gallaecimonas xiamenensis 3-C-1]
MFNPKHGRALPGTKTYLAFAVQAALLGSLVHPAMAAEAEPTEVLEVTGSYVKSLERAVDMKRNDTGFSDSIVAADVSDFPEQNLAEALQRMPGVTIERKQGLGTKVNVRGLPSGFTFTSINGLATASGSGERDVNFDMFASEIIQSVTVKKSPTAADEEGGIAGSVMINTARPFDFSEGRLVVTGEGAYNDISEKTDPRYTFFASNTFGDWGALVSYAYAKRTNRTDSNSGINFRPLSRWLEKSGSSQWQADQTAAVLARDTGITINDRFDSDETSRVVFLDKVGDRAFLNEQEKWGATLSLQYKPSHDLSLTFDALWGGYDEDQDQYDAAAYSASSISALEQVHDFDSTTLGQYGITVLTDVSYAATQHELLSKEDIDQTDYQQYGLTLDWHLADWQLRGLVGYSGADKSSDRSNLKHTAYAPSRTRYTATGGETIVSDNPASIDIYNSPQAYNFELYDVILEDIEDDKYAAQLSGSRHMDWALLPQLSKVELGARYTDKKKTRNQGEVQVKGPAAGDSSWANTRKLTDSELTPIADLVPGGAYLPERSGQISWSQVSNDYARANFRYPGFAVPYQPDQYYQVQEQVLSLYAMADFDFDIASLPTKLNLGMRYVDTSVDSSGFHQVQNADGSTGYTSAPVSKEGDYSKLLPSFNLVMDLSDNLLLRAAASKTMMRPALTDIAYKRSVSLNEFKYRDGNPDLKPTFADQWELGLEYYLDQGGLLAASYFEKDIEGMVRETITGVVKDVTKYNNNGTLDGVYDFDVYQKVNADGSYKVKGMELIAALPLGLVHPALQGFGINSNFTKLDNSLAGVSDLGIDTPPEGLADKAYNLTFYFEQGGFDARLSYNYKDKYVEVIERDMYPVYRDAYGQYDAAIGYQLNDSVKLQLKAINLTDEKTKGYTLDPRFPTLFEMSGRRISLGLRAVF